MSMIDPTPAKFSFKSKHLDVEFEGQADFVTAQIESLRGAFFKTEPTGTADAPPAATGAPTEAAAPAAAAPPAASKAASKAAEKAPAPIAPASPATPAAELSLEAFYKRAKSRIGRGAVQETVLIFAYFLREYRHKDEFGIDNLNACFSLVGVDPPKSLANTLGIMKRVNKFFVSGTRRGQYRLSEKGSTYVKKVIGG